MYALLVISILVLAILQDYVYSVLKGTGFYLSESALYNTIWVFLIPISPLSIFLYTKIASKHIAFKMALVVLMSIMLSLLHIAMSTTFFITISQLAFSTPHRFAHMFSSALSNQFYILILIYSVFPFINQILNKRKRESEELVTRIVVKEGVKRAMIDVESIVLIESDKPYSIVHTMDGKYICDDNLKKIGQKLDTTFMRVHRSVIINQHCISHLESRGNGDYDARLVNDRLIRMSRHFRQNWDSLIH